MTELKRIRYCSDLHLEFGIPFKKRQIATASAAREILLVGGDTMPSTFLRTKANDARSRSMKKAMSTFLDQIAVCISLAATTTPIIRT